MPNQRDADFDSVIGNKADLLEELRGKHHLVKKDYETYQQSSQEEQKENEDKIERLKQENWNLRLHLGKLQNGDERVINSAFRNDRLGRLQLQKNTATSAIKEMDQKVCEGKKQLNLLKYERRKKEYQLKELGEEYENMVESMGDSTHKATEQTIGKLENDLDKTHIKLATAQSLTARLEEILVQLQEDALKMPGKLDILEDAFLDQTAEVERLREVSKAANKQKDEKKREMMQLEQHVYETRKKREIQLTQMKKEVDRRKNEADKVEKKYQRVQLFNEGQEQKLLEEQQAVTKRQHDILKYEDALQRIMESSNVADIKDVVGHYKMQLERKEEMRNHLKSLRTQSTNLQEDKERMSEAFRKMKYSAEGPVSCGQQELDNLKTKIEESQEEMTELKTDLDKDSQVAKDVTQSVNTLRLMLEGVKLSPPEHNFRAGDVFEQLEMCQKKVNLLTKELKSKMEETNVLNALAPEQFNQFVDDLVTSANCRITLNKKESSISGFSDYDYEGQDGGDQAPTRMEIKTIAHKLVAQKMGKKKKKEKAATT